jgi:hypothetical protein
MAQTVEARCGEQAREPRGGPLCQAPPCFELSMMVRPWRRSFHCKERAPCSGADKRYFMIGLLEELGFDKLLWFPESQQYLIRPAANVRVKNSLFVIVVSITKCITVRFEHKASGFDLLRHADRIDSMQCLRIS